MRIIVEIPRSAGESWSRPAFFLLNLLFDVARLHPDDVFIIRSDGRPSLNDLPANVAYQHTKTRLFGWLGLKWWYSFGLPGLLRRQKADLLIAMDNLHVRRYRTPCCHFIVNLVSADLFPAKDPAFKWKPFFPVHRQVAGLVKKAAVVLTFTEFDRLLIAERCEMAEKCICIPLAVNTRPLKWPEKESVKTRYSGGLEYFIFAGDIHQRHQLVELLRAYAEFKKWQKSGMQLVITGPVTTWTPEFLEKLKSFKYRSDVHVVPNPSDDIFKALIGSAYACLYPARDDHFPETILLAIQSDVPVIASPLPSIKALVNNAVIYPEPGDASGFAKCMQNIYKDERLRADVIRLAGDQVNQATRDDVVNDFGNLLRQTLRDYSTFAQQ